MAAWIGGYVGVDKIWARCSDVNRRYSRRTRIMGDFSISPPSRPFKQQNRSRAFIFHSGSGACAVLRTRLIHRVDNAATLFFPRRINLRTHCAATHSPPGYATADPKNGMRTRQMQRIFQE
ncbi:hypothetical protein TcasGA2_TC008194 [Tribolium castaneum]|uniref:Uncharacterized protein n=1 Tax=Tribolium castaneum TaxID=7070 RepID=D2A0D0_TRICA|nr:hypothetical protein TcasGA2_TC008194 [Tribolium castaneum]